MKITLIEILIILSIFAVIFSLTFKGCNSGYSQVETFDAQVLRKYEVNSGKFTVYRVDVRRSNSSFVETLTNEDDWFQKKYNSATLHANLIETNWYRFETRGVRNERWSHFPNIITSTKIESPEIPKGEIDY